MYKRQVSRNIADHIDSFTDYDFAHLLFSDGTVENAISLDNQLNIIQVADLVLPDKDTTFEEYTTIELLSVSMLIVISTLSLIHISCQRPDAKYFSDGIRDNFNFRVGLGRISELGYGMLFHI